MNNFDDKVIFEKQIRFSKSVLWKIQREYYDQLGINAWVNLIPYYITSNPYIAKSYAKIALNFIRNWKDLHPQTEQQPFYIIEFGAGPGHFGFYVIKAITELKENFGL